VAQKPSRPQDLPADSADRVIRFPVREARYVPDWESPDDTVQPAGPAGTAPKIRVRRRVIRQVVILEVAGRLGEVVEDLDLAIRLALAEEPRGVVCDLSAMLEAADPRAVEVLATAGRHVRDWPGISVAVACPDPRAREALAAHPLGGHLVVSPSLFSAITAVLATPTLAVERLQLTPHPTAPRASREFVTRTLLDLRLGRLIPIASRVVSELVARSSMLVGTDIDLSVAWDLSALRLTVRDHGPAQSSQHHAGPDLQGRGLTVVAGLSRTFGLLPAADGGQVVWAVLEAPSPRPSTRRTRSGHTTDRQDLPSFTDGRGLAELPFCAGPGQPRTSGSNRPLQGGDQIFAR
jgi:hypothetical protein